MSLGPLDGQRVVDLFAGSGALAIEALSRGASRAVLVERARPALRVIHDNLASLGLTDRASVLPLAVERARDALAAAGPFDLLLADPPYADVPAGRLARTLERLLATPGLVAPGAVVVVEHASRDEAPELSGLSRQPSRVYGDTALAIYEAPAAPPPAEPPAGAEPAPDGPTEL
jgi:16S rRNA (guanine966-N2)-methyltransferase